MAQAKELRSQGALMARVENFALDGTGPAKL